MNLLSIDVGIKNLAYCLFSIKDNKYYTIESWDVVNLCNEKKYECCCLNNKKQQCKRICRFYKNNNYYCKIHAKNKQYKIPSNEMKECFLKKMKLKKLKEIFDIEFDKKIKKKECLQKIRTHISNNYFCFIDKINANNINIVQIGTNLKLFFDMFLKEKNIDCVIIESQIGPIANRMKTLEGMIIQHFIEKKCPIIKQISSSNKLKLFLKSDKKTTYRERKDLGILITKDILNKHTNFSNWLTCFNEHKKKDDLADSFLQGLWFLISNNKIIFNYSLRLT